MQVKAIVTGTAVGMAAGAVCYMAVKAPKYKKKTLKRRTMKAFDAVSGVASCLSDMFM